MSMIQTLLTIIYIHLVLTPVLSSWFHWRTSDSKATLLSVFELVWQGCRLVTKLSRISKSAKTVSNHADNDRHNCNIQIPIFSASCNGSDIFYIFTLSQFYFFYRQEFYVTKFRFFIIIHRDCIWYYHQNWTYETTSFPLI